MKGTTGMHGSEKQKEAARKTAIIGAIASRKPVVQYDKSGNRISEYESITAAKKALGIPQAQISAVCRGKRKSTYGMYFRFKDKEE